MSGKVCHFRTSCGRKVSIDGRFFGLAREIYAEHVYAPTHDFAIQAGDRVIDLGAHVGVFTLDAASCGAQVLAVEAQSEFLPILEKHALSNGLQGNVTVEHALVAASGGLFSDEKERDEASHWRTSPPVVTFSQLCTKHQIEQIDLLKVDIEGSEFALFEELERDSKFASIKRIALEAHPRYGKPETLVGLLRSEGFRTLTAPAGVAGREHFIYATK